MMDLTILASKSARKAKPQLRAMSADRRLSEHGLRPGTFRGTLREVHTMAIQMSSLHGGREVSVLDSSPGMRTRNPYMYLVCANKDQRAPAGPCKFRINATVPRPGHVKIQKKSVLVHKCKLLPDDVQAGDARPGKRRRGMRAGGRQRNYNTEAIMDLLPGTKTFVPSGAARGGDARQLLNIANKSATVGGIGMTMKQASNRVSQLRNDKGLGLAAYQVLEPFMEGMKAENGGEWVVEATQQPAQQGDCAAARRICNPHTRVFDRLYVAPQCTKTSWARHQMRAIVSCDGTHLTGTYRGILLAAVCKDANNHLFLLAFAVVGAENARNWVWFAKRLVSDFPGIKVIMSDKDKGIYSGECQNLRAKNGVLMRRCLRHIVRNIRSRAVARAHVPQRAFSVIKSLAKARTEAYRDALLARLEAISQDAFAYLRDHVGFDNFVALRFLDAGAPCFGETSSNPAEQVNSMLLKARDMNIMDLVRPIVKKLNQHYWDRETAAARLLRENVLLAPRIAEKVVAPQRRATLGVRLLGRIDDNGSPVRVEANVDLANPHSGTPGTACRVVLDARTRTIECECGAREETGLPCVHALSLSNEIKSPSMDLSSHDWSHEVFHTTAFLRTYADIKKPASQLRRARAATIQPTDLCPPTVRRGVGRPRKRRYERKEGAAVRHCSLRGSTQHNASRRKTPDGARLSRMVPRVKVEEGRKKVIGDVIVTDNSD